MTPIKKINVKITHYTTIQFSCGIKLQTLRKVSSQLPVFTLARKQSDCRQLKNHKTEEHILDGVSQPTKIKFVIIRASFFTAKEEKKKEGTTRHYLRNNIFAEASSLKAESNFAL